MLFPTFDFLVFFIATVVVIAQFERLHRMRKVLLLVASYVFYAQWNWRFCLLLAFSSLVTYGAGLGIHFDRRRARPYVALAVTVHLSVLVAFKYADLLVGAANTTLREAGFAHEMPFLGLILPVGISFFTFHGISYVVDVYRGDVAVCRRVEDMLLYLSFFPQLVAGPIVRASFFLPQLYAPRPQRLPLGPLLMLVLSGLFKKVVIANYVATGLVDPAFFDPKDFSSLELLLAAYGYAVQIYCDFSGYSDIAIGLAGLLGYRFPPNFDQPYRSASFQEFWRRWHISLSSWLRDYLYKPLGGSRRGPVRTGINLMLTMLLGGLWHGAAWKFVAWGGLHGAALGIERMLRPRSPRPLGPVVRRVARVAATLLVFHLVCLAWIFFRADSWDTVSIYLSTLVQWQGGPVQARLFPLVLVALGLLIQFTPPGWPVRLATRLVLVPDWALAAAAGVLIVAIDAMGPEGVAPFIYFQF